jgi:hypothetical protein
VEAAEDAGIPVRHNQKASSQRDHMRGVSQIEVANPADQDVADG